MSERARARQTRTRLLTGAVACALAGIGAWVWVDRGSAVQYRTATVERGDIDVTVSATGNPNARVTVQVGSQVSGNILALFADFNSKVSKDQLIALQAAGTSRPCRPSTRPTRPALHNPLTSRPDRADTGRVPLAH